jgi:hypothetical protein
MSGHMASSFFACGSSRASRCRPACSTVFLRTSRVGHRPRAACARSRAAAAPRAPARLLGRAALVAAHGVGDVGQVAHRAPGTMGVWCVLWRVSTFGSRPSASGRPSAARRGSSAWYSAVTPSSLKRLAMVPNTGISRAAWLKASRLRCTCLATSRSASAAPLRSNLLMATNSAKSSMSIFSSWLAAPNSGVITYIGTSTSGTMAASPWPMPEVSTTMRSKPAALQAAARRAGPG